MNRSVLVLFLLSIVSFPAVDGVAFDYTESVDGDLSSLPGSPTFLVLENGENVLTGSTGGGDRDFITFDVGASQQLDAIILNSFSSLFGVSFVGIQSGTEWTAGLDFGINPALLLGWAHYGTAHVGTDILDNIATGSGAIGFTPPLGPGSYTVHLQDTDGTAGYGMSFMASGGTITGDFDGNGLYECADVDALVGEIVSVAQGGTPDLRFDLTQDGLVDREDLTAWRSEAGAVLNASGNPIQEGDANLDSSVDGSDFAIWNSAKFTAVAAWCSGDFTADGSVDGSDFSVWNANKFQSADGASTVPEPGTFGSIALAAVLSLLTARRQAPRRSA